MIEAIQRAAARPVSRETYAKIERYAALLVEENRRQNLVARSTEEDLWERHIADSAQLVRFEPHVGAAWADVGSGAGLPGIVIALLVEGPVTLIEPRRLRADFLTRCTESLGVRQRVTVEATKVERVAGQFDVITGRAVAPLTRFLEISHHLSTAKSRWVLPKGRNAQSELAEAQRAWHGAFHVERSATDADSSIVVASGIEPRRKK